MLGSSVIVKLPDDKLITLNPPFMALMIIGSCSSLFKYISFVTAIPAMNGTGDSIISIKLTGNKGINTLAHLYGWSSSDIANTDVVTSSTLLPMNRTDRSIKSSFNSSNKLGILIQRSKEAKPHSLDMWGSGSGSKIFEELPNDKSALKLCESQIPLADCFF